MLRGSAIARDDITLRKDLFFLSNASGEKKTGKVSVDSRWG
jgi:hypothetical protein